MKRNITFSLIGLIVGGIASYLYCKKRFEEGCCVGVDLGGGPDITVMHGVVVPNVVTNGDFSSDINGWNDKHVTPDSNPLIELAHSPRTTPYKMMVKLYKSDDDNEPRVITEAQFSEECEDYDKVTFLYYNDGVVIDELGGDVLDIESQIGIKNLNFFGYGSEDKDVLYVRNDKLKILCEVLRQNTEYKEDE